MKRSSVSFTGLLALLVAAASGLACTPAAQQTPQAAAATAAPGTVPAGYFDNSGHPDALAGGSRRIEITTPKGKFAVWTKRVGNNPRIKVLLLHGGPAVGHEYLEAFDSFFPGAGIEYYYYDQLGSNWSDQPNDDDLWTLPRFVDEVEQVRQALGLDRDNFYLYGHSWGGILALEYALAHQDHLKGLIISNMMASIPAYNEYAEKTLIPAMDPKVVAEIRQLEAAGKFDDPRHMELLVPNFYEQHILRLPADRWPDPVNRAFAHINQHVYTLMQGPSEMGASGRLADWDRTKDLGQIRVPTLTVGARHGTMDPEHMKWMAGQVQKGRYLDCPNGSHLAMYDDQQVYMAGVIRFIKDVDAGGF
jgi:proline iminopeptidase